MFTAHEIETLRSYRDAGLGAWTNMSDEDREIYRGIHHKLDELGKANENQILRYTLTSGFNLKSGVRGNRPKDLWCSLSHHDSEASFGMPQIFIIVSDRGVELGFAAAIHRGDFSNQELKQKLAALVPSIFDAIPDAQSRVMSQLSEQLMNSSDWQYRKKARLPHDDASAFSSLSDFLGFLRSEAGKSYGAGAIVKTWGPSEVDGVNFENEFIRATEMFKPMVVATQQALASNGAQERVAKYWIEKTITRGRSNRLEGDNALGKALWSPKASSDGRQIYKQMQEVRPGDVIIHLIDNSHISGVSLAHAIADHTFVGLAGTDWEGRPAFRIELDQYQQLENSLSREDFFQIPGPGEQLVRLHENHSGLFYTRGLEFNQGAYLTEAPVDLVKILNDIYISKTGKSMPHVDLSSSVTIPIHKDRLNGAIQLFKWIYGEEGFSSERYLQEERNYKVALSDEWRSVVSIETLEQVSAGELPQLYERIVDLLTNPTKSNLLPWRYSDALKKAQTVSEMTALIDAVRTILETGRSGKPNIDHFQELMMPLYEAHLNETAIKPASHCIPSLILWLSFPDQYFYLRPNLYNHLVRCLTGSAPEGSGHIMSSGYYEAASNFIIALSEKIHDLKPRDMIDVQGFVWGIFSHNKVWMGGKSYRDPDTRKYVDKLPEFVSQGVYATGYGNRPEIADLLKTSAQNKSDRESRREEISSLCQSDGERKAVQNFFDLRHQADSLLIAKSSFAKFSESKIRLFGICRTGKDYKFDPNGLGHCLSVDWFNQFETTLSLGKLFPKVAGTLRHISLEETLDLIGQTKPKSEEAVVPKDEQVTIQWLMEKTLWPEEGLRELIDALLNGPGQIVLAGPPGTGKTWVAKHVAEFISGGDIERTRTVQFHPSYGYEEFIEGIQPVAENGGISFEPKRGVVLDVVDNMGISDDPYILIIDEMNRANLPRVFGELMYLLEYRDEEIQLQYSPSFSVPKNLHFIGTMNTADRSIRSIDAALRRRFEIFECSPSSKILTQFYQTNTNEVPDLIEGFEALNAKLLDYLDKHHTIGHTFFMSQTMTYDRLKGTWSRQILPLIEEYFFDQPALMQEFTLDVFWQEI